MSYPQGYGNGAYYGAPQQQEQELGLARDAAMPWLSQTSNQSAASSSKVRLSRATLGTTMRAESFQASIGCFVTAV